ncbi:Mitochondrial thiamine pyrophosphate carrier [Paragonimus heterotremus]|uniref:Mitochondrial thiamine pyrophosphate carrier n=1 Tax=Paragonimus heterotremus TaxID=100268 RepID=A0A8J4T2Y8_9TREM|nr:Mitochondrial thiamine pyrophosphate carrier [Paragonimus heterotremus]
MTEDHNSLEDQQRFEKTSFRYNLLAGGLAGSVAKTVIAPLDRAKINFQSTERRFTVRELYRFLKNSFHEAGFLSLWRGNTATLSRIFPYAAIQYSAHERYKHALGIDQSDLSHMRPRDIRFRRLIAGCMAGTTCVACTYPLDFSRARMAVTDSKKYSNLIDAIRTVSREEGKLALYRGFLPAILGVIPYSGIAFFTFETLKEQRMNKHEQQTGKRPPKLKPLENLVCGAFAGILGQTASYPLDIVRRRMQNALVTGHPEYLKSIRLTLRIVYSTEGLFRGLYKGVTLNWIKGPIASGISFTVFHQVQHFLHWYDKTRSSNRPTS